MRRARTRSESPKDAAGSYMAAWFVQSGVDVSKKMLGRSRRRRWALPLIGLLFSWLFVGTLQVYMRVPLTPDLVAGTFLAGLVAYTLAAVGNANGKSSRDGSGDQE